MLPRDRHAVKHQLCTRSEASKSWVKPNSSVTRSPAWLDSQTDDRLPKTRGPLCHQKRRHNCHLRSLRLAGRRGPRREYRVLGLGRTQVRVEARSAVIMRSDTERSIGRSRRLRQAHIPGNLGGCEPGVHDADKGGCRTASCRSEPNHSGCARNAKQSGSGPRSDPSPTVTSKHSSSGGATRPIGWT